MQVMSARFHSTIIMHSRGTPQTMTELAHYSDVTQSVKAWLKIQASLARSPEVILDPGIGFAKSAKQSLVLLREIAQLKELGCPILIGASRKSFIGHTLNQPNPNERLSGSLASVAAAFSKGANIFRVHDVRETRDVVDLLWAIENTFV
jgi:dihydropteroate synthase